jgi:hypothetical protein
MILLNIFFDKLMLQYINCAGQKKGPINIEKRLQKKKKNFLSRLLIVDLKTTFLSRLDVPQALAKIWTS